MRISAFRVAAVAFALTPVLVQAETWPTNPIAIVSGFPGGAATDLYARKLAQELGPVLGVSLISDNRPGAGGNIASSLVARAKPDGYTFLLGTAGTHAINPALYGSLPFDAQKDFRHIALLGYLPNVLLVNPETHPEFRTCTDLIAAGQKAPDQIVYSSTGNGASGHLAAVQFAQAAKARYMHVPYKGQGPAMTALLGGQVSFFFNQTSPSIPLVESGKVKALGVTSAERVPALPNVPTIAEACNLPGFQSMTWYGLFGPADLPDEIAQRMSDEVLKAVQSPDFQTWLTSMGILPASDPSPAAFAKVHAADMETWAEIVKASGARID